MWQPRSQGFSLLVREGKNPGNEVAPWVPLEFMVSSHLLFTILLLYFPSLISSCVVPCLCFLSRSLCVPSYKPLVFSMHSALRSTMGAPCDLPRVSFHFPMHLLWVPPRVSSSVTPCVLSFLCVSRSFPRFSFLFCFFVQIFTIPN